MELAQLRMLKAVVDKGGVKGASEYLHCVQSNVTARIRALEQSIGTEVFYRKNRRLELTPAGKILFDYAERILALSQEALLAVHPSNEPMGRLTLGAIESSATSRLPRVLADFHASCPLVNLSLSTSSSAKIVEDIARYRLDAGMVAGAFAHPDVESREIYRESLSIVASDDAPALHRAEDINGRTLFMWPTGCPYRAALERWMAQRGLRPKEIISYGSYSTIVGCVAAGAGISLVPHGVFSRYRSEVQLVAYEMDGLSAIPNYFIWNRHIAVHPGRDAFLRVLQKHFPGAGVAGSGASTELHIL